MLNIDIKCIIKVIMHVTYFKLPVDQEGWFLDYEKIIEHIFYFKELKKTTTGQNIFDTMYFYLKSLVYLMNFL